MENSHQSQAKKKLAGGFTEKVLSVVSRIPKGKTLSYKQVAEKAGSPRAFRAVGSILRQNYNPAVPCHNLNFLLKYYYEFTSWIYKT